MGVERHLAQHLPGHSTENDGDPGEELVMRFDHELDGLQPDCNDQVGSSLAILVDVPLVKFLLGSFVWKQGSLQILTIEFNLLRYLL